MPTKLRKLPRAAFPGAMRRSQRYTSAHFSLLVPPAPVAGYAVVVPKKVARLAVARNRIRRRVYAAVRDLPPVRAALLFPAAGAASLPMPALREELAGLMLKARS